MNTIPQPRAQGFTLLEMLAVISIIAVLSASTISSLESFGNSKGVDQGIYDVSGLLELARSEAVTRQTYVWVGFENREMNGQQVLCMAAACSKDGSAAPSLNNLFRLTRIIQIGNTVMVSWSGLKPQTRASLGGAQPASVADNSTSVVPGRGDEYLSKSITFTPRGEAMLNAAPDSDTPYDAYMDLSFRQAKGNVVTDGADDAAVIVDGCTGAIRQVRAQ